MVEMGRLRTFVRRMAELVEASGPESELIDDGSRLLGELVANDDWLPDEFAEPGPSYRQYLLHCDSRERFSVVSFVWGPGQSTPIHNHGTWGLIGVLRGAETSRRFITPVSGTPQPAGEPSILSAGAVDAVSPSLGDVHQVCNAFADRVSVSIHAYGANIGRQRRFTFRDDGTAVPFVSRYSSQRLPNMWQ
jgi:predicted metal-dependent enzyme (double-stranded beta helix superfamily)